MAASIGTGSEAREQGEKEREENKMRVISSQEFRNWDIVSEKMEAIENGLEIVIPVVDTHMDDDDGERMFIMIDGHHTLQAACDLGIGDSAKFEIVENPFTNSEEPEDILRELNFDGTDYYRVDVYAENFNGGFVF